MRSGASPRPKEAPKMRKTKGPHFVSSLWKAGFYFSPKEVLGEEQKPQIAASSRKGKLPGECAACTLLTGRTADTHPRFIGRFLKVKRFESSHFAVLTIDPCGGLMTIHPGASWAPGSLIRPLLTSGFFPAHTLRDSLPSGLSQSIPLTSG